MDLCYGPPDGDSLRNEIEIPYLKTAAFTRSQAAKRCEGDKKSILTSSSAAILSTSSGVANAASKIFAERGFRSSRAGLLGSRRPSPLWRAPG